MSNVPINSVQIMPRVVGDVRGLDAQLLDNVGLPLDISGKACTFRLINQETKQVKVAAGLVLIVDAPSGLVRWVPTSLDVDTPGSYAAYFILSETDEPDIRAPYDGPTFTLYITPEGG